MEDLNLIEALASAYYKIGGRYLISASMAFLIFYVILKERNPLQKIQDKFPKMTDYTRDLGYSLLTILIFSFIGIATFRYLKPFNLLIYDLEAKPIWYWLLTLIPLFFIHDFYFYWAHRFMHMKQVFKYVHRVHHLSTNPSPWTAYAFHPLEAVIEGFSITLLAFTVPTHPLMIVFFMIFQIVYNVYGHLGYELFPKGFHKNSFGKWINTSVAHNQHHQWYHGNYGLYTLIWDRVFGTIRSDYDEAYERVKPEMNQTVSNA